MPHHLTFEVKTCKEVQAFSRAALEAGAIDKGGPDYRENYWEGYYATFSIDPDDHNIEAAYWDYNKAGKQKPE
ncbi:hypothetical protein [Microbulbifer epialgicus]|uniref:Glyoxalase/Bleomycin resistance protein/Dioxygenase superfamily protein n=1 Tax=Microbulbifer epialgicus TaxID=393907 RepID=A0ABV4P6C9_9GAMM